MNIGVFSGRKSSRKCNIYSWPESYPSKEDLSVWKKFMVLITNLMRKLIQLIRLSSAKIQTIEEERFEVTIPKFMLLYDEWIKESVSFIL